MKDTLKKITSIKALIENDIVTKEWLNVYWKELDKYRRKGMIILADTKSVEVRCNEARDVVIACHRVQTLIDNKLEWTK